MKKISILIMVVIFTITSFLPAMASTGFADISGTDYDEAVFKVASVGLMNGYDDGLFYPEETMTRAELTAVAVRMSGILSNISAASYTRFNDVSSEHWASGYINMAVNLGLIKGFEDGSFRPDDNISYTDALTIIVNALGYAENALTSGGYPNGYIATAAKLRITNDVEVDFTLSAKRGDIAIFLSNALDVNVLEKDLADGNSYEVSAYTLYEKLTNQKDMYTIEGIVTDNGITSLTGVSTIKQGLVLIDGVFYDAGESGTENYLGQKLEIYAKKERNSSVPVIVSCKTTPENEEISLISEDIESISKANLSYWNENDKTKSLKLADGDLNCIYNGKAVPNAEITAPLLETFNGNYRLIDAEGNGIYETIFITEKESFVVDSVYERTNTIYFANNELLNGRKGFQLQIDDEDYTYNIKNSDGTNAKFADIKKGMTITIGASRDSKYASLVLCDKSVSGTVTAISPENHTVEIDGKEYNLALNSLGSPKLSVTVGDKGTYLLDADGRLTAEGEALEGNEKYAYIAKAGTNGTGISNSIMLLAAHYGNSTKIVKTTGGTEVISYKYENSNLTELLLADSIKLDGLKTDVSSLTPDVFAGKLISYKLNSEGLVKEINIIGSKTDAYALDFNSKIMSFGGRTGMVPFLINESTKVICVPDSINPADDDWQERLTLTNGSEYKCIPANIDDDTHIAASVVIYGKMDADAPKFFDSDTKISIVGTVTQAVLSDGTVGTKIKALTEEEISDIVCAEGASTQSTAQKLRKADLIKYELGKGNVVSNLAYMASVQGLTDYYNSNEGRANEEIYGVVYSADLGCISAERNEIVDRIVVMLGDDPSASKKTIDLLTDEGPQIYIYERTAGNILPGTTFDIMSYDYVGNGASKIFMLINSNEVEAVVIIND